MIHPLAEVQTPHIGKGTNIWQFCVILPGAKIGDNCNICSHVFIENDVVMGNNVTIKNGVSIYNGITLEDNVFIGPNVAFGNDLYPRSKNVHFRLERTLIKKGASLGSNVTVVPGVEIGENVIVGAGSVVTRSLPANGIYAGNPARLIRTIN